MENKFYDSTVDNIPSLTINQLKDLQNFIRLEIEERERTKMFDLREKAITALNNFFKEGGSLRYDYDDLTIAENDDDCYHILVR